MGATEYIKETQGELKRVSWPTRKQVASSTFAIVVVSVVMSLLLGVFDFVFSSALGGILVDGGSPSVVSPAEGGTEGVPNEPDSPIILPTSTGGPTDPNMVIPGLPSNVGVGL